jgi:hypothetical protein
MRVTHQAALALAFVVAPALAAAAEGPVPTGTLALGAERLSGFFHITEDPEDGDSETTDEFALLSAQSAFPSDMPRFAFDDFVTDGLSLGGSLSFVHLSLENDSTVDTLLLAPRVGYATFFSDSVGIWPRGGITYWKRTLTDPDGDARKVSSVALTLEAPLLFSVGDAAWITLGPMLDLGIAGEVESDPDGGPSSSSDLTITGIGVAAGLTVPL